MGCSCMKLKRRVYEDAATLSSQTHFTVKEVKALLELFNNLSSSLKDDGFISKEEFQIGLFRNSKTQSFFADRMFKLFDSTNDGVIEFGEFVRALSIFHPVASLEEKADCMKNTLISSKNHRIMNILLTLFQFLLAQSHVAVLFRLYDVRQAGFIEHQGVKKMIMALLQESGLTLPEDIIQDMINKTFEEADSNDDGKIDAEEWKNFVCRNPPLLKNMTIPYLMDLTAAFPSFSTKLDTDDEGNDTF
ncbi:hypothetical protein DM860_005345 [Cuscuta australis]|uniref:Calcineurin B-like protein n=1 Tax=Cuscuta australis TaxID=267555 RepID=A0A328E2X6_9ASTE|nr:hypothetical protein DM860_005345 [Cuscuta australis]